MKSKRQISYQLCLFIVLHVIFILGLFFFVKKEHFSDEAWSIGLANSSNSGDIYRDREKNSINVGEWISGDVVREYLTVQEDERFHYQIPYVNSIYDKHPPLSFFLIHTLSSLFPNCFSYWLSIPFNIFALILCDIFLYKILELKEHTKKLSIVACVYYALCAGGINTLMLLRMYALATAFALMILYYSYKIYVERSFSLRNAITIIVVNVLGGLLLYEYYVFAFLVAVVTCIYFLILKEKKLFLQYGISMLSGVAIALAIFPYAISDMINNVGGRGISDFPTYPFQLELLFYYAINDTLGFGLSVYHSGLLKIVAIILIYTSIVCIPLFFVLWKNQRTRLIIKNKLFIIIKKINESINNIVKDNYIIVICLVTIIGFIFIMNPSVNAYKQGPLVVRYLFITYPLFTLVYYFALNDFTQGFLAGNRIRKYVVVLVMTVMCIFTHVFGFTHFIGEKNYTGETIQQVNNGKVILLVKDPKYFQYIVGNLNFNNEYLVIPYENISEYANIVSEVSDEENVYMFVCGQILIRNEADILDEGSFFTSGTNDEKDVNDVLPEILQTLHINKQCEFIGNEHLVNSTWYIFKF